MFELFTVRARRVLNLAKVEAKKAVDECVSSHHILVGLLREGSGVGHYILERNGLNATKIMQEASKITQPSDGIERDDPPFNPRTKKIFELAIDEAEALGNCYVGTEHILLALLSERESVACQILMNFGIDIDDLVKQTKELLGFYDRSFYLKENQIFAKNGEGLVAQYEENTDKLFFYNPTTILEIQRIIEAIRHDKKRI